jgi:transposase-like protein
VGESYVWLWIAIEPIDKIVLGIRTSIERSMLVAEQFVLYYLNSSTQQKKW